ncbi:MAG TPA: hypothetical protein VIR82_15290, partial [Bradyrhizobium sp.]
LPGSLPHCAFHAQPDRLQMVRFTLHERAIDAGSSPERTFSSGRRRPAVVEHGAFGTVRVRTVLSNS